jgi:hypothetical protein
MAPAVETLNPAGKLPDCSDQL